MARVVVFASEVKALERDPGVLRGVGDISDDVADVMAVRAPKDSGAGARSIHSEPSPDEPGFRVGWDQDHYYLRFHEEGTIDIPARPFARPTADEFNSRG